MTQFDDFQVGIDNNADGDFDDAGDDLLVADDFSSNQVSLSYDNNGNLTLDTSRPASRDRSHSERRASPAATRQGLTADGVYNYVYGAWNP